jgi:hypothetical protein
LEDIEHIKKKSKKKNNNLPNENRKICAKLKDKREI